jgi:hypothetical protein
VRNAQLIERATGAFVEILLYDGLRQEDLNLVEEQWRPARAQLATELTQSGVERRAWPQSMHWDWGNKVPELELLMVTGFAAVHGDSWEGVMLTKTLPHVSRLGEDRGKPLVYVDYIEVAPWNWKVQALSRGGKYRGIGTLLLLEAVRQSMSEGFHGRVGLHSLPQSEGFYQNEFGMTAIRRDESKEGLLYLELPEGVARTVLSEGGAQ